MRVVLSITLLLLLLLLFDLFFSLHFVSVALRVVDKCFTFALCHVAHTGLRFRYTFVFRCRSRSSTTVKEMLCIELLRV